MNPFKIFIITIERVKLTMSNYGRDDISGLASPRSTKKRQSYNLSKLSRV